LLFASSYLQNKPRIFNYLNWLWLQCVLLTMFIRQLTCLF
jgi:hypothetical protein